MEELIEKRSRNSKTSLIETLPDGRRHLSLVCSMGAVHYRDDPGDEQEQWKDIDPNIVASPKPNWDYEVVKGNWHLLIKDDTTVALGNDGHWIGFRIDGCGYLDSGTKDYVSLFTRATVTPVVSGNSIRWNNIFPSIDLEFLYGNECFKENIYVRQTARDWLVNHPPSDYGLSNQNSYLGIYTECDWQNAYPAEDKDGNPIDWNDTHEFDEKRILFRHPVKDKIVSFLPVGWAGHSNSEEEEDWVPIRSRFYNDNGTKRLIFGAKVTSLNQLPSGTITLDPTYTIGYSHDDAYQVETPGTMYLESTYVRSYSTEAGGGRIFGGYRWRDGTFPPAGSTITACDLEVWTYATSYDSARFDIYLENVSDPAVFTESGDNIEDRHANKTTASVYWLEEDMGKDAWKSPDSLVDLLQEVIDDSAPISAIVLLTITRAISPAWDFRSRSWDYPTDHSEAAKLVVTYEEAGEGFAYSQGIVIA